MSDMKPVLLLCVAAIALAACTKDELADDTRLSEGQYPLQIAAVTLSVEGGEAQPWGAPQTRVSETGDGTGSKWNGGEKIGVQPSPHGILPQTTPSTSATKTPTALPTCCTARARATTRPR